MSNTQANSNKQSPSRNVGVVLKKSSFNSGTPRLSSGGVSLTTPSRINALGKPSTERYQSAYSRLGGLRNSSAPNISALIGDKSTKGEPTLSGLPEKQAGGINGRLSQYSDRYGQNAVNEEGRTAQGNDQTQTRLTGTGKGVGRTESLKEEYLSFSASPEVKASSLADMREPGRRYQSSVSVTPRSIDVPQSFSPSPVLPHASPRKNKVTTPKTDGNDNYLASVTQVKTKVDDKETQQTKVTENQYQEFKLSSNQAAPHTPFERKQLGSLSDKPKSEGTRKYNSELPEQSSPLVENARVPASVVTPVDISSDSKLPPAKQPDLAKVPSANYKEFDIAEVPDSRVTPVKEAKSPTYSKDSVDKVWNTPISHSTPVALPRSKKKLTKRTISFKRVEEDEYIGFSSLPEQVHRKAVRRGFEFTLMVVGETGLGKSTLINSLFLTDLYKDRKVENTDERVHKTVDLEKKELEIEERGVKLKLTIVDTPGFNDAVNAEDSWKAIVNYIDKQFETYFQAESGLNRKNIQDTRVHCCLYFISPYGHGLRPVDVSVMKKLHHKVNIVPLIAKADMLTKKEMKRLKEKVLEEIEKHKINIYQFPDCDSDEDEEFKQQDSDLKKAIPFAVVGSNTVVEAGGKKIRGRMYPWGIVEVENPQHCDFVKLRQMLISTHMQDLKDVTCDNHYENYRAEHIAEQMTTHQKERNKLKRDSTPNLDKALDTERLLQEKEMEIKKMQEMLAKMQAQLHNKGGPQMNGKIGKV